MGTDRAPEFFAGKNVKIGIIGCGYVGLPLALRFADVGQIVTGFDLDQTKVDKLNAGQSYIQHIPADKISQHVNAKKFSATSDFAKLRDMDAVLICVPTPLDERREPDLSYVVNTAKAIAPHLQRNQLIVLETPPDGFYVLVATGNAEAHIDSFNAEVIAGWMFLNHVLSANGFLVINGFYRRNDYHAGNDFRK